LIFDCYGPQAVSNEILLVTRFASKIRSDEALLCFGRSLAHHFNIDDHVYYSKDRYSGLKPEDLKSDNNLLSQMLGVNEMR